MQRMLHVIIAAVLALGVTAARAEEPFYQGKRLTLLINFAPGGPTDVEGRLLAKHIVKHIDGHPTIVAENKDGAAGMVGATYLGELGPRDGTMVGYLTGSAWNYLVDPGKFRVDFRTYAFIADQPGTVGVGLLAQGGLGFRICCEPVALSGSTWSNLPFCHWKTKAAAAPFSPSASNRTLPCTLSSVTPLCK